MRLGIASSSFTFRPFPSRRGRAGRHEPMAIHKACCIMNTLFMRSRCCCVKNKKFFGAYSRFGIEWLSDSGLNQDNMYLQAVDRHLDGLAAASTKT